MTIKASIFDLDGTLANFNLDYMTVRAEIRSFLTASGTPATALSLNETTFEMLRKTETFLKSMGKSERSIAAIRRKALEIAERYELEAAKATDLLPGVLKTLRAMRKMKLKMGICTINSEKSTSIILKRFNIARFFDSVISRESVRKVKPDSEPLEASLKALEVASSEAIFVGDSAVDMRCASSMNVIAVGLLSGISSEDKLVSSGANYLITSITDLPPLVRDIDAALGPYGNTRFDYRKNMKQP